MKILAGAFLAVGLLLAGCGQNPSDELLKQIAASTKENADTSKQILAALNNLKTDPALLALVTSIDNSTKKLSAAPKVPFAFPIQIEPNNPADVQQTCMSLGYTNAINYAGADQRWYICK